jgi:TolA-binding protein
MAIDVAIALSALKSAADLIGAFRNAVKNRALKPDEVSAEILKIQELVSDARSGLIEAQEEIARLNGEIRSLDEQLAALRDLKDNYEFRDNMYWRKGTGEGPFCQTCMDADKKVVRLLDHGRCWFCSVHQRAEMTQAQREHSNRLARGSSSGGGGGSGAGWMG